MRRRAWRPPPVRLVRGNLGGAQGHCDVVLGPSSGQCDGRATVSRDGGTARLGHTAVASRDARGPEREVLLPTSRRRSWWCCTGAHSRSSIRLRWRASGYRSPWRWPAGVRDRHRSRPSTREFAGDIADTTSRPATSTSLPPISAAFVTALQTQTSEASTLETSWRHCAGRARRTHSGADRTAARRRPWTMARAPRALLRRGGARIDRIASPAARG